MIGPIKLPIDIKILKHAEHIFIAPYSSSLDLISLALVIAKLITGKNIKLYPIAYIKNPTYKHFI